MGEAIFSRRSEQRDAMIGVGDIEVDASDIYEVVAILVPLEEEVTAVIVFDRGTTGIVIKNEISVLVRLRPRSRVTDPADCVSQITKASDRARGILEQIEALLLQVQSELFGQDVVGDDNWICLRHALDTLAEDADLARGSLSSESRSRDKCRERRLGVKTDDD